MAEAPLPVQLRASDAPVLNSALARCQKLGVAATKADTIRLALRLLNGATDAALRRAL